MFSVGPPQPIFFGKRNFNGLHQRPFNVYGAWKFSAGGGGGGLQAATPGKLAGCVTVMNERN
jgi:hypothetical protein